MLTINDSQTCKKCSAYIDNQGYCSNGHLQKKTRKKRTKTECKCWYFKRVLDKKEVAWQVCLNCFSKERIKGKKE